jgi:hypothetical protein
MSGILDRLNQELETFGRRAQQAFDEGRLQLEKFRLQRERDEAARRLGYLVHRKERGQNVDHLEVEAWMQRMDALDQSIAKVDREMTAAQGQAVSVNQAPAPEGATTGEAEVVK